MKVKTLSRNAEDFTRERPQDLMQVFRNPDPVIHPFEKAREYTRALNATKLEKVFAKPFVGALDGHVDSVNCLSRNPRSLITLLSGSCDGEVRIWDLAFKKTIWRVDAHNGFVRGLCVSHDGETFFSCGDDKTIKQWKLGPAPNVFADEDDEDRMDFVDRIDDKNTQEPLNTFIGKSAFTSLDHHWNEPLVATAGAVVEVWDHNRSDPIHSFEWGADSVLTVRFNPAEVGLLASTAVDRSIALYDLRGQSPIRKLILKTRSNALAWNPMEAFNFTVANEDHQLYTFDMRKLDTALTVHKDHVSAVLDVDYSPTGREFVSGSYDRTIRIFRHNEGKSREVYHTKRMQRVFCVKFSGDARFVLSGSDDTNIRIWKARAAEALGTLLPREKEKTAYQNKLKARFRNNKEIKRIARHQHVPRAVFKAQKQKQVIRQSEVRKEKNVRAHSKPDSIPYVSERKKRHIKEVE